MDMLNDIQYWHWLIFGLALIILEVFVPSAIFLWPGIAALITGTLAFFVSGLMPLMLILIWSVLSVICAFGWQLYRRMKPAKAADQSTMNRRGEQYIGRHFTLTKDIVNGNGELHVDDTRWKIASHHDIVAGTKVKVTGVEGTSLRVEESLS